MEAVLMKELNRMVSEDFLLNTEEDLKPNSQRYIPARHDFYLLRKPERLKKKYKTYKAFREDYVSNKGRFKHHIFQASNHNKFWKLVIEETDNCIKNKVAGS